MQRRRHAGILLILAVAALALMLPAARAEAEPEPSELTQRLQEIYDLRSRWILTSGDPPPVDADYLPGSKTAAWALHHEHGKIRYMRQWAKNRGVQIIEAKPEIRPRLISSSPDKARFYVAQSLQTGYTYPGEGAVNRSGFGTRHIIELRRSAGKWLIAMEWYLDPLGDDTEVPDVTPAITAAAKRGGYDRAGAVRYANQFCGLAWGCGNGNQYNPQYRDYNGVGGDCTNFITQALVVGGKLPMPIMTRVETLASHLRYSGRGYLMAKGTFQALWQRARKEPRSFQSLLKEGDLIAYQEKGKLEHFAIITAFDPRGYPLVNTHTADRFQVPFDLGWDRKTVYWLLRMRD